MRLNLSKENKIVKVYSLQYIKITDVFLRLIISNDVSSANKGIKNATIVVNTTVISKVIIATM